MEREGRRPAPRRRSGLTGHVLDNHWAKSPRFHACKLGGHAGHPHGWGRAQTQPNASSALEGHADASYYDSVFARHLACCFTKCLINVDYYYYNYHYYYDYHPTSLSLGLFYFL